MKALLLVGGKGTRLHPLTYRIPKPMVPMANRPFLEHVLDWLRSHGVTEVILTTCYLPEVIERHFGDGCRHGVKLHYVYEEEPLGTGGAIKHAEHLLDDTFLVLNGDILTDLDLGTMVSYHRARGARITIALTWVDDPTPYGVVDTNRDGRILRFVEKPPPDQVTSHYINAGTYVFDRSVLDEMPAGTAFSVERELYPRLLEKSSPLFGFRGANYWIDIGTAQKYLQAHHDILEGRIKVSVPAEQVHPGLWVGQGAEIHREVELHPPLIVGSSTVLERGTQVHSFSVIGDRSTVAEDALIEGSVIWPDEMVERHAELHDCIIGHDRLVAASGEVH